MARKANNSLLHKAKGLKSDEFYTQYCDIERELQYYESQFYGKTVYCNCDEPSKSNFFKYFIDNFHKLRLEKVIASCYVKTNDDLFSTQHEHGMYSIYTGEPYINDLSAFPIRYFDGNGDFRSGESIRLLSEADIVVTNPPFSLFREFVSQLIKFNKKFLVIGNINAITYSEIFKLIQENRIWLGQNLGRGISGFIVPDNYPLYGTENHIDEDGKRIIASNNCLWITNLETPLREEEIKLTKKYYEHEDLYPSFDNYPGINVNKTQDIPMDYYGVMGVPITFLHKYNPHQFEIVRFRKGMDGKDLSVNGKCPYFRILIRNISLSKNELGSSSTIMDISSMSRDLNQEAPHNKNHPSFINENSQFSLFE